MLFTIDEVIRSTGENHLLFLGTYIIEKVSSHLSDITNCINPHQWQFLQFGITTHLIQHLKLLDTFGPEKKINVHRFTNNLLGLQKVAVKDFS